LEIHRAIFLAGISARLADLVDTTPELIDPPLVAAVKRAAGPHDAVRPMGY